MGPEGRTVDVEGVPEWYEVETILSSHPLQTRGRGRPTTIYLVTWLHFWDEHNTWERDIQEVHVGRHQYVDSDITES